MWTLLWACTTSHPPHADHAEHADHADHADPAAQPASPHPHAHDAAHHRFDDAEKWAKVFDDPERDAWQKPADVVAAIGAAPGMGVADIGAGTGYFSPHLAAAVGPQGRVVALDIEPTLIAHMQARAGREATPQVEARLTTATDPGLRPAEADRVLTVDTYHHIADRTAYFSAVKAGVKPGGKLVIVDFKKEETPMGPPVAERLTPEQVAAELSGAGFTLEREVDALPYQYILVFAGP